MLRGASNRDGDLLATQTPARPKLAKRISVEGEDRRRHPGTPDIRGEASLASRSRCTSGGSWPQLDRRPGLLVPSARLPHPANRMWVTLAPSSDDPHPVTPSQPDVRPDVRPTSGAPGVRRPRNDETPLPERGFDDAPERTRTSDLRFRRPTLYPTELLARERAMLAADGATPHRLSRDRGIDSPRAMFRLRGLPGDRPGVAGRGRLRPGQRIAHRLLRQGAGPARSGLARPGDVRARRGAAVRPHRQLDAASPARLGDARGGRTGAPTSRPPCEGASPARRRGRC